MCATVGSVIPHIEGKRLRPLGLTSDRRVQQYPDIPPIGDTVKGYEFTAWIGAFAPAGTPKPIVDRLNAELKRVVASPDVAKILGSQTLEPLHMTPDQFAERLRSDYDKYAKVIKLSGARID
jgi:tripartite-type tricarboxylate transporter receptor subunit TctC